MFVRISCRVACLLLLFTAKAQAGHIAQYSSDFIPTGDINHVNSFHFIGSFTDNQGFYNQGSGPYTEDSISVSQINHPPGNTININIVGINSFPGIDGFSWYPNLGDNGFTEIRLAGGALFEDVEFNYSSGGDANAIVFDLLLNGSIVKQGTAPLSKLQPNLLGFSGGGFDTIRVRDNLTGSSPLVGSGDYQALIIDNITTSDVVYPSATPEPSSIALLVVGAVGAAIGAYRKRRHKKVDA